MPRLTIPISLTLQFPNQVQPPAYGAAAVLNQVTLAVNATGQVMSQPAHQQTPLIAEDMTPELLVTLNQQFAVLGLEVRPLGGGAAPGPVPAPAPEPSAPAPATAAAE